MSISGFDQLRESLTREAPCWDIAHKESLRDALQRLVKAVKEENGHENVESLVNTCQRIFEGCQGTAEKMPPVETKVEKGFVSAALGMFWTKKPVEESVGLDEVVSKVFKLINNFDRLPKTAEESYINLAGGRSQPGFDVLNSVRKKICAQKEDFLSQSACMVIDDIDEIFAASSENATNLSGDALLEKVACADALLAAASEVDGSSTRTKIIKESEKIIHSHKEEAETLAEYEIVSHLNDFFAAYPISGVGQGEFFNVLKRPTYLKGEFVFCAGSFEATKLCLEMYLPHLKDLNGVGLFNANKLTFHNRFVQDLISFENPTTLLPRDSKQQLELLNILLEDPDIVAIAKKLKKPNRQLNNFQLFVRFLLEKRQNLLNSLTESVL